MVQNIFFFYSTAALRRKLCFSGVSHELRGFRRIEVKTASLWPEWAWIWGLNIWMNTWKAKRNTTRSHPYYSATAPVHPELLRVALAVSRPWWIRSRENICHSGPHVLSSHQVSLSLPSPSPSHFLNLHGSFIPHRKKKEKKKKSFVVNLSLPQSLCRVSHALGFFSW